MYVDINMQENVRKAFIKYLKTTGIKQKYIANKLNVVESSISRWKNNKNNLSLNNLIKINNYLNKRVNNK